MEDNKENNKRRFLPGFGTGNSDKSVIEKSFIQNKDLINDFKEIDVRMETKWKELSKEECEVKNSDDIKTYVQNYCNHMVLCLNKNLSEALVGYSRACKELFSVNLQRLNTIRQTVCDIDRAVGEQESQMTNIIQRIDELFFLKSIISRTMCM